MIAVTDEELQIILEIINNSLDNCKVIAFGSRVKLTHRNNSDLDLAFIKSDNAKLSLNEESLLKESFSKSDLPFFVDIRDYNAVSSAFREIINKNYEIIYDRRSVLK